MDGEAARARDRLLAAVVSRATSLGTLDFDAGRDLRVRLAFGFSAWSAKADVADVGGEATFATGLRPSPSCFAKIERRSEYAGAVKR
jgi:hypothetical protein